MTTQTESVSSVFEELFDNLRKAADANIQMQQELFRQWGAKWPGLPTTDNAWLERLQKFQKDWSKTLTELMNKHRKMLDDEYRVAIDGVKEAFRVAESADPQEYRERCEGLCRKSVEIMREVGELQMKESQEALNRLVAVLVKGAAG
jgi:hypothetical protein